MNKLIITNNYDQYQNKNEYVYNLFSVTDNRSSIFDIKLESKLNHKISEELDNSLNREEQKNKFSYLCYQELQFRIFNYIQFKLRINKIIKDKNIKNVVAPRNIDSDYIYYLKYLEKVNTDIKVSFTDTLISYSNDVVYENPYDIPVGKSSILLFYIMILYYKILRIKNLYLPDSMFGSNKYQRKFLKREYKFYPFVLNYISLSVRYILKKLMINKYQYLERKIIKSSLKKDIFSRDNWHYFSEDEFHIINNVSKNFFLTYPFSHLLYLEKKFIYFLKFCKIKKIILSSDLTPSSLFIISICNRYKILNYYLPHGVIFENVRIYNKKYSSVRLSWNNSMHKRCSKFFSSILFKHPFLLGNFNKLKKNEKRIRSILILTSDWSHGSFASSPNCRINNLKEILLLLNNYEDINVDIKLHSMPEHIYLNVINDLNKFKSNSNFDYKIINYDKITKKVLLNYDFIFVGPTTGIIDCSLSQIPFIIYKADLKNYSIFDNYKFPYAEDFSELKKIFNKIYTKGFDYNFDKFYNDLKSGINLNQL